MYAWGHFFSWRMNEDRMHVNFLFHIFRFIENLQCYIKKKNAFKIFTLKKFVQYFEYRNNYPGFKKTNRKKRNSLKLKRQAAKKFPKILKQFVESAKRK